MIDDAKSPTVLVQSDGEHSFVLTLEKHRMKLSSLSEMDNRIVPTAMPYGPLRYASVAKLRTLHNCNL